MLPDCNSVNTTNVEIIEGNLFSKRHQVILHGCNVQNTMGKGFAAQLAKAFPAAKAADLATEKGDHSKLGSFSKAVVTDDDQETVIYNCYTQLYPNSSVPQFDYKAWEIVLNKVAEDVLKNHPGLTSMAMPMIGAGLAGGIWTQILSITEKVMDKYPLSIQVWILPTK